MKKGEVEQILHMVGGLGDTSYASNSKIQEKAITKARHILEESLGDVYRSCRRPEKLAVADLGCSCGPTTFMVISEVMDTIFSACQDQTTMPEVLYFLNDLPGNDFNNIFKRLSSYQKKMREEKGGSGVLPFYAVGAPGSFYERLFPKESIHFMHSSYSLHWLSQVPKDIVDHNTNGRNIDIAKTSPKTVQKSYLAQFQQDFSTFLKLRSIELVSGGQMVITLLGRSSLQQLSSETNYIHGLLGEALNSMVCEGIIEEQLLHSFDLPIYTPALEEVKEVVHKEGSFCLTQAQTFYLNLEPSDEKNGDFVKCDKQNGEYVANSIRSVLEPMLLSHFGEAIIDNLFSMYAKNLTKHLLKEKIQYFHLKFSLKKIE